MFVSDSYILANKFGMPRSICVSQKSYYYSEEFPICRSSKMSAFSKLLEQTSKLQEFKYVTSKLSHPKIWGNPLTM